MIAFVLCASLLGGIMVDQKVAFGHNKPSGNCLPDLWGYTPPDNEVGNMWQGTYSRCNAVPSGGYSQQSGNTYVSYGPSGWAWFYMQHNQNEYVQLQLNGPPCGSTPSYPACSGWSWYGYWQQNPDGWQQEQVNTYSGGPSWYRTGWF